MAVGGSMGECGEISEEYMMDSEVSERVLEATTRHIVADTPACRASLWELPPSSLKPQDQRLLQDLQSSLNMDGMLNYWNGGGCGSQQRSKVNTYTALAHSQGLWLWVIAELTTCNGSIAECNEEEETWMESEISTRVLAEKRYISAGALKPDQPVCGSKGGQSYSGSCLPPPSNPATRGCSKYYRCRSDS